MVIRVRRVVCSESPTPTRSVLRARFVGRWALLGCVPTLMAACVRGPNVQSDGLGLRRVVVYRNGVGYFERAGRVLDERVSFRVRRRMIDDFLASLAVIEAGGSSVRSASFPVEIASDSGSGQPAHEGRPRPTASSPALLDESSASDSDALRTVTLHLDGKEHELAVGYLSETPVWRPSYRVVIVEGGQAELQAWGIVHNLSGEDWSGVSLSLAAGAPIAFQSTLGTPAVPTRPIITDEGEVVSVVPAGVISLDASGRVEPPGAPSQGMALEAGAGGLSDALVEAEVSEDAAPGNPLGAGSFERSTMKARPPRVASKPIAPPLPAPRDPSGPRRLADLASVAQDAGATRYDIPYPVTVPDASATMVLLSSQRVPGEAVLLFAPEPGVPESGAHPFRVARFQNSTPGLLERGTITVFEHGSFLGQGLLEPLPTQATATVPFALDRTVALGQSSQTEERGARLHRIEGGRLWVEQDAVQRTTYSIASGSARAQKLFVKYPRSPGARLHQPPPGTEDNEGQNIALVPIALQAHSKAELVVDERRGFERVVDWLSPPADEAVQGYLEDSRASPELSQKLRALWTVRALLRKASDESVALEREAGELERINQETRQSLRAIEKNPQVADLRARLAARLDQASKRLDVLTQRRIELGLLLSENQIRFREASLDIKLERGLPALE